MMLTLVRLSQSGGGHAKHEVVKSFLLYPCLERGAEVQDHVRIQTAGPTLRQVTDRGDY